MNNQTEHLPHNKPRSTFTARLCYLLVQLGASNFLDKKGEFVVFILFFYFVIADKLVAVA